MKNYSARKLLSMVMDNIHTPYCQHNSFPAAECLCIKHEFNAWKQRIKSIKKSLPKARPIKMHFTNGHCGSKQAANHNTDDIAKVSCGLCLRKQTLKQPSTDPYLDGIMNQLN